MLKIIKKDVYDKIIAENSDLKRQLSVANEANEKSFASLKENILKLEEENKILTNKIKTIAENKKIKAHLEKKKWLNAEYGEDYENGKREK